MDQEKNNTIVTPPSRDGKDVPMDKHQIKFKTYIEFEIVLNSDDDALAEELKMLIGLGQFIIIWSKKYSLQEMLIHTTEHNLAEYVWDYKLKDSFYYGSVDFLIDNNQALVDMFIRNDKQANYITKVV